MKFVHNRPHDNDCWDDFIAWFGGEMVHWRDAEPCDDTFVCALQDPVSDFKARRLAKLGRMLNGPEAMNRSQRESAYIIWREAGLDCPDAPQPIGDNFCFPLLLKDTTRQMGRGYYIDNGRRLDWVLGEAKRFDWDKFKVIPFIDIRDDDGFYMLHRYLVCGDKAIPGIFAKTRNWCCKASHMARDLKNIDERQYVHELEAFWDSEPPAEIVQAVKLLGLDFALVDATVWNGRVVLWEANPYTNLRPAEAAGKRERWWPFMASYLSGHEYRMQSVSGWDQVKILREWKGYKTYWRA